MAVGPPYWIDKPVAILASGPSLKGFNYELLRPFHVLVVKSMIFDVPWAEAGFGLDIPRYVEWVKAGKFKDVRMPVYWAMPNDHESLKGFVHPPNVDRLNRTVGHGLSNDPGMIYSGGSSGFGAFGVAWLKRAKVIGLFGFDYTITGGTHVSEEHYKAKPRKHSDASWREWARAFGTVKPKVDKAGVHVFNGCKTSTISAWPKMSPVEAVAAMKRVDGPDGRT